MRSAEEVADSIIGSMGMAQSKSSEDRQWLIDKLTTFRDEAVKEALEHQKVLLNKVGMDEAEQYGHSKGRSEALEEAAKIADNHQLRHNSHRFLAEHIAKKIRALKK